MEGISLWADDISASAALIIARVIEYLPNLVGALLLLIIGWIVARLLRAAGVRAARWFNVLLQTRLGAERAQHFALSNTGVRLLGDITFWVVVLLFVTASTRVLGLDTFTSWLDQIIAYLPTLFAGALIMLVGYIVSTIARDLTTATVLSTDIAHAELFGRTVQVLVLVTALVLGINQIGIDVTLLVALIAIVALAFALGAASLVGNLIGAHYLQQHYRPGQTAIMGDVEGEILELTPVSVVLATAEGRVTVPAKVFNERATALIKGEGHDEQSH